MSNVALSDAWDWRGKRMPGQDELPSSDGEPMETGFHDAQAALLKDTLLDAWSERQDFFVGGNMFVYFSAQQLKGSDFRGPDVFVVLDVENKGRKSWVAWEEQGRLPDVVVELTSESTAHVDRGQKMDIYARVWRTPAYFIFDPETNQLDGFGLDPSQRRYVALERNAGGDFPVYPLGLWLGLRRTKYRHYEQDFVRWIGSDGHCLPSPWEQAASLREQADGARGLAEQERSRAEQERHRAEVALRRVAELEEQLRGRS